jgi:hypothetical protein
VARTVGSEAIHVIVVNGRDALYIDGRLPFSRIASAPGVFGADGRAAVPATAC